MSADRVLVGVLLGCVAVWGTAQALPAAAWLAVVSVLLGGVITGLFSWYYYRQASEELRREAGELRHYIDVLASFLESLELDHRVRVGRDPRTGRIVNVEVQRSAASSPQGSSSAEGTLTYPDPPRSREEGS